MNEAQLMVSLLHILLQQREEPWCHLASHLQNRKDDRPKSESQNRSRSTIQIPPHHDPSPQSSTPRLEHPLPSLHACNIKTIVTGRTSEWRHVGGIVCEAPCTLRHILCYATQAGFWRVLEKRLKRAVNERGKRGSGIKLALIGRWYKASERQEEIEARRMVEEPLCRGARRGSCDQGGCQKAHQLLWRWHLQAPQKTKSYLPCLGCTQQGRGMVVRAGVETGINFHLTQRGQWPEIYTKSLKSILIKGILSKVN